MLAYVTTRVTRGIALGGAGVRRVICSAARAPSCHVVYRGEWHAEACRVECAVILEPMMLFRYCYAIRAPINAIRYHDASIDARVLATPSQPPPSRRATISEPMVIVINKSIAKSRDGRMPREQRHEPRRVISRLPERYRADTSYRDGYVYDQPYRYRRAAQPFRHGAALCALFTLLFHITSR